MRTALLAVLGLLCLATLATLFLFRSAPTRNAAQGTQVPPPQAHAARAVAANPEPAAPGPGAPGPDALAPGGTSRQAAESPSRSAGTNEPVRVGEHSATQTLHGSVRSLGGPALAGARLELQDRSGELVARATSTDEGSFTLYLPRPVQAGRLELQAPGHVPFSLTGLRVPEGAHKNLGQLHLDPAAPFEGRVLDARGEPRVDVRAILHVNARGSRLDLAAVSGADGVFLISGAPSSGRYVLELVLANGTAQSFPVTLPTRRMLDFRL